MRLNMSHAWVMLSERKIIQPIIVSKKVESICAPSFTDGNRRPLATSSVYLRLMPNNINGRNRMAWQAPQTMNVQLAPCQKPLTKKMINVFRITFHRQQRLPPKGIYMQSRNQVVSEMCQRLQNSAMSREKQGKLKLRIRRMPKRRAVPIAMSEQPEKSLYIWNENNNPASSNVNPLVCVWCSQT